MEPGLLAPLADDVDRVGLPFILTQYRQDAIEHLFNEILNGRTPRAICEEDMLMPPYRMVTRWLATNAAFRAQYVEICKAAILPEIMEAIHIADTAGPKAADRSHAKLRIDTRIKLGERLLPEVFGRPAGRGTSKPPPANDPLGDLLQAAGQNGHGLPKVVEGEIVEEDV